MSYLPHLRQVKGGAQLRSDVDQLLASYQAVKVLTDISKPEGANGEDYGEYNVNELLTELKTTLNSVISGADGISLQSLQDAINGLNNKTIKDAVRITGTANYSSGAFEAEFPNGFSITAAAPSFDTTTELPVYYLDNHPVLDRNGDQLTFDFFTGEFSGTPYELDVAASKEEDDDTLVYKAVTESFQFKVFPVGQFTLGNIPDEFLLDNAEVQLLAYDQVINKIIVELAKDEDVIAAISAKVGAQTVQDQIEAITDALETRIAALESNKIGTSDIVTTIRSQENAENSKIPSEKAVIDAIAEHDPTATFQSIIQQQSDRISALESITVAVEETFPITGATDDTETTTFPLTKRPNAQVVKMLVNHLLYTEDEDFTVDRSTNTVTWLLGTRGENGFKLTPSLTDSIRVIYHSGTMVQNTTLTTIIHADAIPTTGTFKVGDMVIRITPFPTKNMGWICTEAGSPGTWTEFGIVDFKNTIYPVEAASES